MAKLTNLIQMIISLVYKNQLTSKVMQEAIRVKTQPYCQTLCFEDIKSGKFKDFPKDKFRTKRNYAWTTEQSYLYMSYLKSFTKEFDIPIMGKFLKFFTRMARLIKTRTSHQIKSHHQKLMMKHRSFELVIKHVQLALSIQISESEQLLETIKRLDENTRYFFKAERAAVDELFRFYRIRIQKQGGLNRQLEEKLMSIIPDLPRSANVKIQENESNYKFFDLPINFDSGQSRTACKNEFIE